MSAIHPTAIVAAGAHLGVDVAIGPYSVVGPDVQVGDRCVIKAHVVIEGHTRIGAGCVVFPFASLGQQTQDLKYKGGLTSVEIGEQTTIREYVTVHAGTVDGECTRVGGGCLIMAYCHVAHGCKVGDRVIMSNGASLAGDVTVEPMAVIGGLSGVHQFCRIGCMAMVGGMTKITQDVPPYVIADGNPAVVHGLNKVAFQRRGMCEASQKALKEAFRILYRSGYITAEAVARIETEVEAVPEVARLVAFVKAAERGILK